MFSPRTLGWCCWLLVGAAVIMTLWPQEAWCQTAPEPTAETDVQPSDAPDQVGRSSARPVQGSSTTSEDAVFCAARANTLLDAIRTATVFSVAMALSSLFLLLGAVYLLSRHYVQAGWFQTLLLLVLPTLCALVVFRADTASLLDPHGTGGGDTLGSYPEVTCRSALVEATSDEAAAITKVLALKQTPKPASQALGIAAPLLVFGVSIVTVVVAWLVGRRERPAH